MEGTRDLLRCAYAARTANTFTGFSLRWSANCEDVNSIQKQNARAHTHKTEWYKFVIAIIAIVFSLLVHITLNWLSGAGKMPFDIDARIVCACRTLCGIVQRKIELVAMHLNDNHFVCIGCSLSPIGRGSREGKGALRDHVNSPESFYRYVCDHAPCITTSFTWIVNDSG